MESSVKEKKSRKTTKTLLEIIQANSKELGLTFDTISELSDDLPRKWEKHGDLVLLSETSFTRQKWETVDKDLLWTIVAKYFGVKKIAKKGRIQDDNHRTPKVSLVWGDDPWVCHVDNRIKYNYDVTKCMFSIGNITEKMRMAKLDCEGEIVVDMFAGIGYFTLPLLVHAKAAYVHACEWNKDAVEALQKNLITNKVNDKCSIYHGDNRKICPVGIADRVIMGLIPSPSASLEAACKSLKRDKSGVIHYHCNVESNVKKGNEFSELTVSQNHSFTCNRKNIPLEWISWAKDTCGSVERTMSKIYAENSWPVDNITAGILHIERVKSYAPHIDHLVLDINIDITTPSSVT